MARGGGEAGPRQGARRGWPAAGGGEAGRRRGGGLAAGRWRGWLVAGSRGGRAGWARRTTRANTARETRKAGGRKNYGGGQERSGTKSPSRRQFFPLPCAARQYFTRFSSRWSVSRLLDRAGTNFRAILRVLRLITRRRVITRTITRDERLNGRLMGNRRADPRVARNID